MNQAKLQAINFRKFFDRSSYTNAKKSAILYAVLLLAIVEKDFIDVDLPIFYYTLGLFIIIHTVFALKFRSSVDVYRNKLSKSEFDRLKGTYYEYTDKAFDFYASSGITYLVILIIMSVPLQRYMLATVLVFYVYLFMRSIAPFISLILTFKSFNHILEDRKDVSDNSR